MIIFVFALCNCSIDIAKPTDLALADFWIHVYAIGSIRFRIYRRRKSKSRVFVILVGFLFVFGNINNIYILIFGDADQGVVLLQYTIQENEYTFMKRSTQRSIFIQVLLFSSNGIYTIYKDRKQELMIFATGNIYRETGTALKEVERTTFVTKTKRSEKPRDRKSESQLVGRYI